MTSSTNTSQRKAREDAAKNDRRIDKEVTIGLMSHPDGRRWVWNRLSEGYIFVADTGLEPYRMAYEKGLRNTGLRLLKDVQAFTPNDYVRMVNENTGADMEVEHDRSDPDDLSDN